MLDSRRARIEELVFAAVDDLNLHRQPHEKIVKASGTLIHGEGSTLDSLGLVTLSVDLEERIQREYGHSPQIVAAIFSKGGVGNIGSLVAMIDTLLDER